MFLWYQSVCDCYNCDAQFLICCNLIEGKFFYNVIKYKHFQTQKGVEVFENSLRHKRWDTFENCNQKAFISVLKEHISC